MNKIKTIKLTLADGRKEIDIKPISFSNTTIGQDRYNGKLLGRYLYNDTTAEYFDACFNEMKRLYEGD